MPNTPKGYSTPSDRLLSLPNDVPPMRNRVRRRDKKRRNHREKRRMSGNLKRGFRLLLSLE